MKVEWIGNTKVISGLVPSELITELRKPGRFMVTICNSELMVEIKKNDFISLLEPLVPQQWSNSMRFAVYFNSGEWNCHRIEIDN